MKHLLEKSVLALISGDKAAAKAIFKEYATAKSRAILEKKMEADSDLVHGHCDGCGEEATINPNMKKSWECGHCGDKKFISDKKLEEAIEKGAFHRWLGKPEDADITDADIEKGLHSKNKHARKMAQFAKNMQHIKK